MFVIAQIWPCLLATLALGALVAWFLNRSTSTFVAKAALPDFGLFAQHGDLPKMPDLSGFARRIEIPSMPDLSHHALRSDLPDVSGFITAAALAPLALKSDIPHVPPSPDLSPYAKKSDIPASPDLSGFALKKDIPHVPPPPDLSIYARTSDLPAAPDLSFFALKSDIPHVPPPVDLSGYVHRSELPAAPDLSGFARKSDIPQVPDPPDLSGFARISEVPSLPDLSGFVHRSELPPFPDLSGFARKSDLPATPDLSGFARLADVPERTDLSTYARRSDLPDLSGVVRVRELEMQLHDRDATIARLTDSLRAEEEMRAAEIARLEGVLRDSLARTPELPKPVVRDDLEKVYGIGPVLAKRLNKLGVSTFAQIARWSDVDIDTIEPKLDTIQGRIRREGWVPDSSRLHEEKYGEHIAIVATRTSDK